VFFESHLVYDEIQGAGVPFFNSQKIKVEILYNPY
jgi:hypothetical protein